MAANHYLLIKLAEMQFGVAIFDFKVRSLKNPVRTQKITLAVYMRR